MLARELIQKLESRGFTISLTEDGGKQSIEVEKPEGVELTDEDRWYLRSYRTELMNWLTPLNFDNCAMAAEACPVCSGALFRRTGKRFDQLECPTRHFSRLVDNQPEPQIKNGDLIIPFSASPKYHYWRDEGQKLCEILAELNAGITVWRRYCATLTPNHADVCGGAIRQLGEVIFCRDCGRFAPAD